MARAAGERRSELQADPWDFDFPGTTVLTWLGHFVLHFTVFLCQRPRGWTLASIRPRLKNWN